jgi:hypothetical protein
MQHRRLLILFAVVSLLAFGVIIWYFLFSTPQAAPTLGGTANPLSLRDLPARLGFIFNNDAPPTDTETEVTLPGAIAFKQIWDKPTTGNIFVTRPILQEITATTTVGTTTVQVTKTVRATTTVLMFVDRITGYIYGHNVDTGSTYQISNTSVPGIYDAYIWSGGDRILVRYLDSDRKTIISTLSTVPNIQEDGDPQPLAFTTLLPKNISSVAVSPSLQSISYVVPNDVGSSIYTVTSKGTTRVADSPFTGWSLSYGGEQLYATSKASAYVEGSTYLLPSFSRLVGEKTGLSSTPSTNGLTLNSMWAQSGLITFGASGNKTTVTPLKTIATKCAAMDNPYFICGVPLTLPEITEGLPDDWYQGRVSFNDTLKIVNGVTGESYALYEIDQKYGEMDITHIHPSSTGNLISYIRKQDGTLFLLNVTLLSDGN